MQSQCLMVHVDITIEVLKLRSASSQESRYAALRLAAETGTTMTISAALDSDFSSRGCAYFTKHGLTA